MKPSSCAALALVLLPACRSGAPGEASAPQLIAGSGDISAALDGVQSLSFHPSARRIDAFAGSPELELRGTLESALIRAFRQRGYRVQSRDGERWLGYALGVTGAVADEELARQFGISPGLDLHAGEGRGGIVLLLSDARSGLPLWRASGSAVIGDEPLPREERNRRIEDAVEQLLAGLQPR